MGKQGGGAFNQRDLTVLILFANQASIAIDNARLFQKLSEEEGRLRLVLNSAAEAIYGIDMEGICTLANPACLRMLGYAREEELIGKQMHATIHHSRADGCPLPMSECSVFKDVLEGREAHTDSEVHWRKDGTSFPVEYWAHPKVQDGRVVGAVVTFVDITERKKAEDALQRSNADLERFAYSVSHDMRQPLRAISGHLQLLKLSLKDKLDENDRENLGFALDGAHRMDSMIVSLLEYSRVGRKTESKQFIASRVSLDEALGFLKPLIDETHTEMRLSGEWPQVFASHDELARLIQNLVGNAIKFREKEQPALVEINSTVEGKAWRVCVRDYGVGINSKQIGRLFQFFSRLQSRGRFEGTGMGLALCRRIVEQHNGRIWVESEGEGKGSVFMFELPLPM